MHVCKQATNFVVALLVVFRIYIYCLHYYFHYLYYYYYLVASESVFTRKSQRENATTTTPKHRGKDSQTNKRIYIYIYS